MSLGVPFKSFIVHEIVFRVLYKSLYINRILYNFYMFLHLESCLTFAFYIASFKLIVIKFYGCLSDNLKDGYIFKQPFLNMHKKAILWYQTMKFKMNGKVKSDMQISQWMFLETIQMSNAKSYTTLAHSSLKIRVSAFS